ncbi:HPr family phosphocarrier protein [Sphingomonas sp. LY54]|uniref:HPr family phosphocarrier protein n=1 Tax=Sphingomonadales TaxID=204457 RepID=UPI002ADED82A|nr:MULTISPECIES: HPr family phosphocarrier protein [Sphingomonadales]MEA1013557.1 HPr family phosphocarrier protein [Sphingosinicella sp. LY1275]WRP28988.1 HPr family phosphocarrier protein [Sphingomonas sp. LY54]
MPSRTVDVLNKRGLHARASAKFVTMASEHKAEIEVEKDGSKVCGTSIMGLMMLGAAMGDTITISASGDGADAAVAALAELVEAKFGEE